jgi:hypothetical protein
MKLLIYITIELNIITINVTDNAFAFGVFWTKHNEARHLVIFLTCYYFEAKKSAVLQLMQMKKKELTFGKVIKTIKSIICWG